MTRDLAYVDSWFGLLEDQLSALWVDAMNPLLDPRLANSVVNALFDAPAGVRLHPVLLTGQNRPDFVLIDDNQAVHVVIENKVGAAIGKRSGGGSQLDAYARDNPNEWLEGLSRAKSCKLIFLTAGTVPKKLPGNWTPVTYKSVYRTVDAQLSGDAVGATLSEDGRVFWTRFRRELDLATGRTPRLTFAEAIEGCALAALPFPTSSQAAMVRRTQGYFASMDGCESLLDDVALSDSGWRCDRKKEFWVVHRLRGQGDKWSGFNIWFGVPGVPSRHGSRMVVGRTEPPGPLGRLYVSVAADRADGELSALRNWIRTEIRNGPGLSVLLQEVEYPPQEQTLNDSHDALGFWAFDPLAAASQTARPADRYAATLKMLVRRLTAELTPPGARLASSLPPSRQSEAGPSRRR